MQIFIAVRVRENLGEFGEWTSVRVEYDYEVYFGGMIPRIHTIINTDTKERVNVTNINEEDMELIFKEMEDAEKKKAEPSTGSGTGSGSTSETGETKSE